MYKRTKWLLNSEVHYCLHFYNSERENLVNYDDATIYLNDKNPGIS